MNLRDIVPFEGLGDLRFGTPRSSIRTLLGSNFKSFRKDLDAPNETDSYDELGLHLYYDQNDTLEFIEAFPPSNPSYNGVSLLGSELDLILKQLAQLGYSVRYDDEGYMFDQLGFVLYVPYDSIEAVSIYRKGYYNG